MQNEALHDQQRKTDVSWMKYAAKRIYDYFVELIYTDLWTVH